MIDGQTTIFDMLYEKFKIDKPIRLIELFGGYGSQALALKYLGVNFEHWKLVEWAVKSIQAYKDIHFPDDNTDYSKGISAEDVKGSLFHFGISQDYNQSMKFEQVMKLKEQQARTIYNNIVATHNLVDIQTTHASDLEIVDTDKYCYIMTYSFPCQDLSLAGKGKGMSDTSTRSGLLWEVERILSECYELGEMPQVLLMENVPQVHSEDNLPDFNKWKDRLEELGYKNYFQDLIATDYGIPQTRNRTFMISILGDYNYTFPKPISLKLKLKDMLEENVNEKYYLSDKMIKYIWSDKNSGKYNRLQARESCDRNIEKGIASTITTRAGQRATDNFIKIKNNNSKGYLKAFEGDGVNISSRMKYQRGNVQKEKIQTIDTMGGESKGVVIRKYGLFDKDEKKHQAGSVYDKEGISPTLDTATGGYRQPMIEENNNLKIRRLTPKECFALMGVKQEDYERCAKNQSDRSLYHLAGDSIVVNVLMAIFKEMIGSDKDE